MWLLDSFVILYGFGLSGSFPNGAGRISREMNAEKGDEVYKCWKEKKFKNKYISGVTVCLV